MTSGIRRVLPLLDLLIHAETSCYYVRSYLAILAQTAPVSQGFDLFLQRQFPENSYADAMRVTPSILVGRRSCPGVGRAGA